MTKIYIVWASWDEHGPIITKDCGIFTNKKIADDKLNQMKIKVSDERKGNVNYANANILECVKFWNREGEDTYVKNRFGTIGSKETNEMALNMSYDDFVLEMLLIDCKTFSRTKDAT